VASILIIDDNQQVGTLMCRQLERSGHRVELAQDGAEGLRCFVSSSFDLIITDIVMPENDGLGAIRQIQAHSPGTKIIAVSGGGHRIGATDCLSLARHLGARRTLEKPFDTRELVATVEQVLAEP